MSEQAASTNLDHDQAVLDLEDARHRLEKIRQAIEVRDALEATIFRLTQFLRQAKRKLKEAGWNLAAMLSAEKRKGNHG